MLDTIKFDNEAQQESYYKNHPSKIFSAENFSPKHEDSKLYVEGNRRTFEEACYLMYQFEGKWYYAFVNGCRQANYNSDTGAGTVEIEYELDLMQTYLFKVTALQNLFTTRRHLPNTFNDLSPRNYDEITPLFKNFARVQKFGLRINSNSEAIKWVVMVCKNKDKSPMSNGELNPFSMFCFPVSVGKNGFNAIIPQCTVNGTSWGNPISGGVNETIQAMTGNTTSGNSMTNNVVNLYVLDDVPISWTLNGDTVVVTDQNAKFETDPVNIIHLMGATSSATEEHIALEDVRAQMWTLLSGRGVTERQLLNSTLCGVSLANSYGAMDLEMKQLLQMDTSKLKILKRSYVTEQGSQLTTIDGYCGNNQIAVQMGIKSSGKPQTVLSNSTATYMQANKNSYALKKEGLDLRQEQLNASQHLQSSNLQKTLAFGQKQNDINYGLGGDIAFYGQQAGTAINGVVGGVMSGLMGGGVLGALGGIAGAVTSGAQIYQNVQNRDLQEKRDTYSLKYQQQSVNLSQQQAQQNMDFARKGFIAENADRALQPLTINQMGVSNIADYENDLYIENLVYWKADDYSLTMANNELMRDGTFVANYYNMSDMLSCRPNFNRVQIAHKITMNLNQAYKEMIEQALTKGVRFWNYSARNGQADFDAHFMFDYNCG